MLISFSGGGVTPNISPASGFGGVNQNASAGIAPLERDSVDISAEKKIKKTNKSGLSTGAKWALGILGSAAAIYGCVVGHRMLNKPTLEKVQKNFSEIFRRDVTKEEAEKLAKQYKEIFKIDDADEFCKKMFEQVKKDYGYKDCDIPLRIRKITEEKLKEEAGGGWVDSRAIMLLRPYLSNTNTITLKEKYQIFSTLMHEFQHVKQTEISYRTSKGKLLKALKKDCEIPTGEELQKQLTDMKESLKNDSRLISWAQERGQTVEELKKDIKKALNGDYSAFERDIKEVEHSLDKVFGKFPKIESNTEEYKKGLKYIDNAFNYVRYEDDKEGYLKQILEAEAYNMECKLLPVIKKFLSIN